MNTEQAFNTIMESRVFRLNGEKIDLCNALIDLSNAIMAEEETNWDMGDGLECSLADLVIGSYWALTECHDGQYSKSYAAMCAIGRIYNPGMVSGPEEDTCEYEAYELVSEYLLDPPEQSR